ncbi:MAG: hypothetical protein H6581_09420 [Bacteroidia bacterium]|nr:hypothetical protein [Bacteroidia bacterium]
MSADETLKLVNISESILGDARAYLEHLPPDSYAKPLDLLFEASIGQHTRHFVEFYQCLLAQCLACQVIDYDQRVRDRSLETDPGAALEAIERVVAGLRGLNPAESLQLEADYGPDSGLAVRVPTNLGRELIYNIEHTVHHLAIIKIGLKSIAPDLKLPAGFGVAASTLRFRSSIQA